MRAAPRELPGVGSTMSSDLIGSAIRTSAPPSCLGSGSCRFADWRRPASTSSRSYSSRLFPWMRTISSGAALFAGSALLLVSPLASRPTPPRGPSDATCWSKFTGPGHWSHRPLHASLIAAFGAFAAMAVWHFTHLGVNSDGRAFFFFARLMHPGLGLTPALPAAIMAAVLYLSCLFRLRVVRRALRLRSEGEHWVGDPLFDAARGIREFATSSLRSLSHILWMGSTVGLALFLWQRIRPRSLEGWSSICWWRWGLG